MIAALLAGIGIGICLIMTISLVQKLDDEIGKLTLKDEIVLMVLPVVGIMGTMYSAELNIFAKIGLPYLIWMLLFTSYTDRRCGMVYSVAVYACSILEALLLTIVLVRTGVSQSMMMQLITGVVALLILWISKLARADCFILFSCFCFAFMIGEEYGLVVMVFTFAISAMTAIVMRFKTILSGKWMDRFPFTSYICFGFYTCILLIDFMKYL